MNVLLKSSLPTVALTLALLACAAQLADADRKAIRGLATLSVSTDVDWRTGAPRVTGFDATRRLQQLGVVPALVGAVAGREARTLEMRFSSALQTQLAVRHISVAAIVRDAFIAELARDADAPSVVPMSAQGHLRLKMLIWELVPLSPGEGSDALLRPSLKVAAALHDASGKLLWTKEAAINTPREPWEREHPRAQELPAYRFARYAADASLTEGAFRKAAEILASDLVEDLAPR